MASARTHLVWDWNGTLLNDLDLVVASTNAVFATVNGPVVTPERHRRQFRRPISDYYAEVLGRLVDTDEFDRLDKLFHDAYRTGMADCALAADALTAIGTWTGTQSLLSMWFHDELVPAVETYGLTASFTRVDGLRTVTGGQPKAESLAAHLDALGLDGTSVVLIGDSLDDGDAADSVGAHCVLYTGGFTDPDRLRAAGRPVAETLTEAVKLALL